MASQTDLKTLMEFTGHTQVSTVMGSYVFATTESMAKAVNGMDQLRPRWEGLPSLIPPELSALHQVAAPGAFDSYLQLD